MPKRYWASLTRKADGSGGPAITAVRATRRWAGIVVILAILALALLPLPAAAATPLHGTPLQLLRRLEIAGERPAGYDAEKFPHWRNADGDGCDTRAEVLIAESLIKVSIGPDCAIRGGRWRSAYDGVATRESSTFDVDHMVPLKEAWESGARGWSEARRQAYANDLGDRRSLRAVTASTNRSKGEQSPDEWMPPNSGIACRYLDWWIAVKVRWRLTVDSAEHAYLKHRLTGCPTRSITVRRAPG